MEGRLTTRETQSPPSHPSLDWDHKGTSNPHHFGDQARPHSLVDPFELTTDSLARPPPDWLMTLQPRYRRNWSATQAQTRPSSVRLSPTARPCTAAMPSKTIRQFGKGKGGGLGPSRGGVDERRVCEAGGCERLHLVFEPESEASGVGRSCASGHGHAFVSCRRLTPQSPQPKSPQPLQVAGPVLAGRVGAPGAPPQRRDPLLCLGQVSTHRQTQTEVETEGTSRAWGKELRVATV